MGGLLTAVLCSTLMRFTLCGVFPLSRMAWGLHAPWECLPPSSYLVEPGFEARQQNHKTPTTMTSAFPPEKQLFPSSWGPEPSRFPTQLDFHRSHTGEDLKGSVPHACGSQLTK